MDLSDFLGENEAVIDVIPLNDQTNLVVRLIHEQTFDQKASVDIRIFVAGHNYVGWSKKGIRFGLSNLKPVIDALQHAIELQPSLTYGTVVKNAL